MPRHESDESVAQATAVTTAMPTSNSSSNSTKDASSSLVGSYINQVETWRYQHRMAQALAHSRYIQHTHPLRSFSSPYENPLQPNIHPTLTPTMHQQQEGLAFMAYQQRLHQLNPLEYQQQELQLQLNRDRERFQTLIQYQTSIENEDMDLERIERNEKENVDMQEEDESNDVMQLEANEPRHGDATHKITTSFKVTHEMKQENLHLMQQLESIFDQVTMREPSTAASAAAMEGKKQTSSEKKKLGKPSKRVKKAGVAAEMTKEIEKTQEKNEVQDQLLVLPSALEGRSEEQLRRQFEIEALEDQLQAYRISRHAQGFEALIASKIAVQVYQDIASELLHHDFNRLVSESLMEAMQESERRPLKLSAEEEETVKQIFYGGSGNEVLIQKFNVDMTRKLISCLLPLVWLNDEVVNFWFNMLQERDKECCERKDQKEVVVRGSHFFNSFFYTKLSEGGYNYMNVRRWTRKLDLFAMEKIFVPVNISNTHWCLAVIYMQKKRIQYYDSMLGSGRTCLENLLRYLSDEYTSKQKQKQATNTHDMQPFDVTEWSLVATQPSTPQQTNGSDCGVFACIFADYLSRNNLSNSNLSNSNYTDSHSHSHSHSYDSSDVNQDEVLTFTQSDMPFFRQHMAKCIVHGRIAW